MKDERLFVVTVASEKGGVGKTTVATNLAVYLKALREDLPVAIASFDNHFTVESMFAIGGRRGGTVAELFQGGAVHDLLTMGEYGVQFIASDHALAAPNDDPLHLARALAASSLQGVLILDTRPVLDYFTRNALHAADLVLVPVKDRPSLVNAASIHRLLQHAGAQRERVWLLPSLIDRRLRLRPGVGMADFLTFSARDRGYQVLDIAVSKSPRVERLTTSFTSRVHPVITHASGTAVHLEMRALAEFVLQRADAEGGRPGVEPKGDGTGEMRRFRSLCPRCKEASEGEGHVYQALSRRRFGSIHPGCLAPLLDDTADIPPGADLLVLVAEGAAFAGMERCARFFYDASGARVAEVVEEGGAPPAWQRLLEGVIDAPYCDLARETVLISLRLELPERFLRAERKASFARLRRAVLRDLSAS